MPDFSADRTEVDDLADRLRSAELLVVETRDRLAWMEAEYRRVLAGRLARLEELEAERLRLTSGLDEAVEQRATQARNVADQPTAEERHRSVVKRIHPDRAVDEEDRLRRESLMRRVNDSWLRRDMDEFFLVEAEVDLLTIDQIDDDRERATVLNRICSRFMARLDFLAQEMDRMKSSAIWPSSNSSTRRRLKEETTLQSRLQNSMKPSLSLNLRLICCVKRRPFDGWLAHAISSQHQSWEVCPSQLRKDRSECFRRCAGCTEVLAHEWTANDDRWRSRYRPVRTEGRSGAVE